MKQNLLLGGIVVCLGLSNLSGSVSFGDESTSSKIKDNYGDAKTDTKKALRKGNQNLRKATGNDNILKDAKDKANDAGDDISNSADK